MFDFTKKFLFKVYRMVNYVLKEHPAAVLLVQVLLIIFFWCFTTAFPPVHDSVYLLSAKILVSPSDIAVSYVITWMTCIMLGLFFGGIIAFSVISIRGIGVARSSGWLFFCAILLVSLLFYLSGAYKTVKAQNIATDINRSLIIAASCESPETIRVLARSNSPGSGDNCNRWFRESISMAHFTATYEEFLVACKSFFRCRTKYRDELRSLLAENFHQYQTN